MNANRNIPHFPSALGETLAAASEQERQETEQVWRLLEEARPEAPAVDTDAAWDRLVSAMPRTAPRAADRAPVRSSARRRSLAPVWLAAAVGALVLVAALYVGTRPVTFTASPGSLASATLPDGSVVELNAGSSIAYARGFRSLPFIPAGERTVRLEGEAYFDVTVEGRPFVVETQSARVEVLGTRFNVRARAGETEVVLESGSVRVANARQIGEAVVLAPGQATRVAIGAAPAVPDIGPVERATVWRRSGFAATDLPMNAIFAEVERRFGIEVEVRGVLPPSEPLSVYYPGPVEARTIVNDLASALGLRYRATASGYEVYR
jgi:transmembrane sensor